MDQIGAFGRTVEDAARLLEAVAGHDPLDATSADVAPPALTAATKRGVAGLVIGVPEEYFPESLDPGIRALVEDALARLEKEGAELRSVSLRHTRFAIPTYYVLAPAEASSNLSRFDGVRYGRRAGADEIGAMYEETRSAGFGAEVKRRIMLGTYVLSAGYYDRYYGRAERARAYITQDFRTVFSEGVDVLFTPTTPTTAFSLGARVDDPVQMYLSDVFTVTANLAGIPGMSVPVGILDGLPVGGQILAPWWREDTAVAVGAVLEATGGEGP
jgi:aspartyl-tRNA(Asn)/glutamyl-tRNA(Gln) amidotransferase subunit A